MNLQGRLRTFVGFFSFPPDVPLVDQGGFFLHCLFRIEDGGKDFIVHLDQSEGLLGDIGVNGGHGRHLIPAGPDLA